MSAARVIEGDRLRGDQGRGAAARVGPRRFAFLAERGGPGSWAISALTPQSINTIGIPFGRKVATEADWGADRG